MALEHLIYQYAQVHMINALVIHRPARELEVAEPDLDPFRARRHDGRHLACRALELGGRPLPVARVETDDLVRVAEVLLAQARVERTPAGELVARISRVPRTSHRS